MKSQYNDILPTNTVDIQLSPVAGGFMKQSGEHNTTWMLPAGTIFKYDKNVGYAVPIKNEYHTEEEMPTPYSSEYFTNGIYYYRSLYNILLSTNPLYCSYYLTNVDAYNYFSNVYINPNMFMGFIVTTNHITRKLLSDENIYNFRFKIRQSVAEDFGLYQDVQPDDS